VAGGSPKAWQAFPRLARRVALRQYPSMCTAPNALTETLSPDLISSCEVRVTQPSSNPGANFKLRRTSVILIRLPGDKAYS
jgi:hypothetical protein